MAFMPGKIVHTNEILVLLGDNWFAERSAKQAIEIIERRLECKYTPERTVFLNSTFCFFELTFTMSFNLSGKENYR